MTERELHDQIVMEAKVVSSVMWQGSRITRMLNQAQDWLQGKLIKQGYMVWSDAGTVSSLTPSVLEGVVTAKGDIPSDMLRDLPIESVFPQTPVASTTPVKSWASVKIDNFNFVANNDVTKPSTVYGIYAVDNDSIHIHPVGVFNTVLMRYTRRVLPLVFDNDSLNSEIPNEMQWVLIDRVVMQIKSIMGNEQVKQAKLNEIDKELSIKYKLDALVKQEAEDRSQVQ